MGSGPTKPQVTQLWQLPLLIFSLFLFGYTAYIFIDPKAGPTAARRIEQAREFLKQDRPEAANALLRDLLTSGQLPPIQEGAVHMLLAESIDQWQHLKHESLTINHTRIIEQTKLAIARGIEADAAAERRLADSYEALGNAREAITHYRKTMELDPGHALQFRRRVIDMQLAAEDHDAAAKSLDEYLKLSEVTAGERAWAMGEMAHVLVDKKQYEEARKLLGEAIKLAGQETTEQGRFNYWLGYCAWKLGNLPEAERYLRVARDQLRTQHPLDADAAYALGKIRQEQKDYTGANSFYASVIQNHLDSPVAQLAKLWRGVCRIALGDEEAGLSDLHDQVKRIRERESTPARLKEETIIALRQASALLSASGNVQGALEVIAYEQELQPKAADDFFLRLGRLYERYADQIEGGLADARLADRAQREEKVRQNRSKAGDAYIAYARLRTLQDDNAYGQALWRGIELYESAGDLPRVMNALETFIAERPDDPLTPDALMRLGQAYHVAGLFDKAIGAYRKNQFRYSKSLAASKSGVPLARAYIAKGPDFYKQAEATLKAVVEDNPQVTPDAQEFRESIFELAKLYSRTARYEMAIAELEEMTHRYPSDERMGQLLFLMADAYRNSAGVLDAKIAASKSLAATKPSVDLAEAIRAKRDRLGRARDMYTQVIEYYRGTAPARNEDKQDLKLAHFYRADCVYDLADYPDAIKLYGEAAFRYQDDTSSLAAYIGIINANVSLGKIEEAKAANERAMWVLRRMPKESFDENRGNFTLPRQRWDEWLNWARKSGIWK